MSPYGIISCEKASNSPTLCPVKGQNSSLGTKDKFLKIVLRACLCVSPGPRHQVPGFSIKWIEMMSLTATHSRYRISRRWMRRSLGTITRNYFWFRFIPSRCLVLHIRSSTTFLPEQIRHVNVLLHSCIISTWQNQPKHKPKQSVNTILLWNISKLIYHSRKGTGIPLQAWTGPEISRKLRLPDFLTIGTWRW
jgi:hypothetical protein